MKDDIQKIRAEFRRSGEARYVHRLHGVLLVLLGLSTVKAGKLLGVPQRTIAHWAALHRKSGLSGLEDPDRTGHHRKLDHAQSEEVARVVSRPPSEAGMDADAWTGILLSDYVRKRYSIEYTPRHCVRLLRTLRKAQS